MAALRGGGWNVPTFVTAPVRAETTVSGTGAAAGALGKVFAVKPKASRATSLVIGTDLAPQMD